MINPFDTYRVYRCGCPVRSYFTYWAAVIFANQIKGTVYELKNGEWKPCQR